MKIRAFAGILDPFVLVIAACGPKVTQTEVPYASRPWPARVWKSEMPAGCPFEPSKDVPSVAL